MTEQIDSLVREARELADTLKAAPEKSVEWYEQNHLLSFVATIEERKDAASLSLAAQSLQYLIADQWDFGAKLTKRASVLAARASTLSKELEKKRG